MNAAALLKLSILSLAVLTLTAICPAQANLAGDWKGTVDAGGSTFHVAWHAVAAPDGTLTSTLDNIDENVFGIKVKSLSLKGTDLTMTVDDTINVNGQDIPIRGEVAGKISPDGNKLSGTWTQTDPEQPAAPLELERSGAQTPTAPAGSSQPNVVGDWAASLSAGGAELRLLLHIKTDPSGVFTGTLDSIDQGANDIPISSIAYKDGKLNLNVAAVKGTYDGTVNKDATEITGTWSQGQPLDLNFKRAQAAAPAPRPAAATDLDGVWTGKLETPAVMLTINLKFANMDTGLTAQIQSPDQSPNWAPANSITRDGDTVTVVFKAFGATYEGKISADHATIDGKFSQMGNDLPLVLKKS